VKAKGSGKDLSVCSR